MRAYVPERGDLVWIDLNPQLGHEQSGHRPALVLSPILYNRKTGLCVICPATRRSKGYLFEVPLEPAGDLSGVILADHVRNVDWRRRRARFIRRAPPQLLDEVVARIDALLVNPED